jgi:hypothetical protein
VQVVLAEVGAEAGLLRLFILVGAGQAAMLRFSPVISPIYLSRAAEVIDAIE